jgi:hypothetical protein
MGIVTSDGSKHIVKDNLDEDFIEVIRKIKMFSQFFIIVYMQE